MKIAIAGLGNMGSKIIEPIQQAAQTTSVIGFDPSSDMRSRAQQKFGIETADAYREILNDPDIRVVFIAAPNEHHKTLCLQALEAGKAVMCEKPIATTLADAELMVETAERLNGYLQIGFELRYSQLYLKTKKRINDGLIGQVVNTQCTYICSEFHGKNSWRNSKTNGGMFGEKLSHYVDLPRWWIDSPVVDVTSVCAPNVVPYYEVRDNYHTTCCYENGAVSHLTFMMALAQTIDNDPLQNHIDQLADDGHELRYLIQGTKGAIETSVFGRRLRRWEFGDSPKSMTSTIVEDITWTGEQDNAYVHNTTDQAIDVIDRVSKGLPPYTPPRDSLETMKVVIAAERSADTGETIRIDELDHTLNSTQDITSSPCA